MRNICVLLLYVSVLLILLYVSNSQNFRRITAALIFCVIHFIHSFMFYVVFDHDIDWGDGGDCDTDVAEFTDRDTAINYARDIHQRVRVTDGCTDRWSVRRVMHDDAAIDWAIAG